MRHLRNGSLLLTRFAFPPLEEESKLRSSIEYKHKGLSSKKSRNYQEEEEEEQEEEEQEQQNVINTVKKTNCSATSKNKKLSHELVMSPRHGNLHQRHQHYTNHTNNKNRHYYNLSRTAKSSAPHKRHTCKSLERLKEERQLYMMDAQREWYFSDFTSLKDEETGVFTIPLQFSGEEYLHSELFTHNRNSQSISNSSSSYGTMMKKQKATGNRVAEVNSPMIGHPFEVEHQTLLDVHIFQPERQVIPRQVKDNYYNNIPESKSYCDSNHIDVYPITVSSRIVRSASSSAASTSSSTSSSVLSSSTMTLHTAASSSLSFSSSPSSSLLSSSERLLLNESPPALASASTTSSCNLSSVRTPHHTTTQLLSSNRYTNNPNARLYWELQGCEEEDEEAALERALALSRAEALGETQLPSLSSFASSVLPSHTSTPVIHAVTNSINVESSNHNKKSNNSVNYHSRRAFHCRDDTPLSISSIPVNTEEPNDHEQHKHVSFSNTTPVVEEETVHRSTPESNTEVDTRRAEIISLDDAEDETKNERDSSKNCVTEGIVNLSLHDLLTIIDLMNSHSISFSQITVNDVTEKEDCYFLQALRETLTKALRRRLHLDNHHRGLRNNGQTSRHRT